MNNILITGATQEDRIDYTINLIQKNFCSNISDVPCENCSNCLKIKNNLHPNLIKIEPLIDELSHKQKDINIEQVRQIIEENQKTNFCEGQKFFVVTHMHKLTKSAANALLKTIEESGNNKCFLGLAPSKMSVLSTIASRLEVKVIKPKSFEITIEEEKFNLIKEISLTPPSKRFSTCLKLSNEKEDLYENLMTLHDTCHQLVRNFFAKKNYFISPNAGIKISEALNESLAMLEKNINTKLIIEHLILNKWPFLRADNF